MGAERPCRATLGKSKGEGRAYLETDFVAFTSDTLRFKWRLADIKRATAEDRDLVLVSKEGTAKLDLGTSAPRWAKKITSPPTLLDKLGIKETSDVAFVSDFGFAGDFAREAEARAKSIGDAKAIARASVILLAVQTKKDLAIVAKVRSKMRADAALWVVYPKGQKTITDVDVIGAGRDAKLRDVKVARFSETHAGFKFVVGKT